MVLLKKLDTKKLNAMIDSAMSSYNKNILPNSP